MLTVAFEVALFEFEKVTVPGPLIFVHVPVPTVGTAARAVTRVPHTLWSGPAAATGFAYIVIV